jgi:hypothetical protein
MRTGNPNFMVVLSFFGEAKPTLVPVIAKFRSSQTGLLFSKSRRRYFFGQVKKSWGVRPIKSPIKSPI